MGKCQTPIHLIPQIRDGPSSFLLPAWRHVQVVGREEIQGMEEPTEEEEPLCEPWTCGVYCEAAAVCGGSVLSTRRSPLPTIQPH